MEGGVPALSPMESGMKRVGSDVSDRNEASSWLLCICGNRSSALR